MSTQNLSPELFTNKIIDNNKLSTFFCKVFALAHTYDNPLLYDNTDNQRHDHLPVCLITFIFNFHLPVSFSKYVPYIPVGAHLNPAVTLSFCVLGKVSWSRLVPYSLSQVVGAFVASGVVYLVYYGLSF